jgi:hypothetical protein
MTSVWPRCRLSRCCSFPAAAADELVGGIVPFQSPSRSQIPFRSRQCADLRCAQVGLFQTAVVRKRDAPMCHLAQSVTKCGAIWRKRRRDSIIARPFRRSLMGRSRQPRGLGSKFSGTGCWTQIRPRTFESRFFPRFFPNWLVRAGDSSRSAARGSRSGRKLVALRRGCD